MKYWYHHPESDSVFISEEFTEKDSSVDVELCNQLGEVVEGTREEAEKLIRLHHCDPAQVTISLEE